MAIKIEMLRAFAAVAQTGRLADAATRLGRTPSAISMTLKALEDHLGQRLFETDRKNRLTPLGAYVLEQAQSELRQFDETVRAIEAYASSPVGLLRVAAVPSVAALAFPRVVDRFLIRHPGVTVQLWDRDSLGILEALTRGQIDIGIAASSGAIRGVSARPLFSDPYGVITAAAHPLAKAPGPLRLADLRAHRILANDLAARVPHAGLQDTLTEGRISAQNTLSLLAMLRAGGWVAILPQMVWRLDPHGLAFRPLEDLRMTRQVDLLIREDKTGDRFADGFARDVEGFDWAG